MKTMRKILALLLVLTVAMTMGMAVTVTSFAAKNDSITVTGAKAGETYELYKLFDLSVNSEETPTAYSYKVNSEWTAFFATGGAGAEYVTINSKGYVTKISNAEALAKAAAAWSGKPSPKQTKVASGASVEFTGLEDGYWLITSTLGTLAMAETTPDKAVVTINEKNPEDSITKQVKEDSSGEYGANNDAQIGDTVEFKSVATLLPNTRNVSVVDTMDSGLTYTTGSVAIEGLTKGSDYTVTAETATGFTITFSNTYISGLTETATLNITYTAKLNEKAVASGPALISQKNTVVIKYGDKQSAQQETTTTTHKFSVFKHATGETNNLAGAVFSLKKNDAVVKLIKIDDTNYRIANGNETGAVEKFTTVSAGDIVIWGVDSDFDYALQEITPPAGYNELPGDVSVTVSADNNTRIDVENKSGTKLPSTGGMGTTLFYIIGALLVIGCGILLIARRRMNAK